MESLLIASLFLSVVVVGEFTLWGFQQHGQHRSFLFFTIPYMLMGHPLFWLLVAVAGFANLIQVAGHDRNNLLPAVIWIFTGVSTVVYMVFRFMPRADMLIWGRRWSP